MLFRSQELNFKSFVKSIDICMEERVEFVLIAGDLFDTAFPGIDVLKETFGVFKKLHDSKIPCFIIAGSHDYSVSGKTFLDVLEKAGFCKNIEDFEEKDEEIILNPTIYEGVAFYGYPGRKSGLEVQQLRKIKFNDAPGMFKILMLHTTIDKIRGTLPIDAIETESLPYADYYAMGHIHQEFQYENFVYPGPIFPNNFQEIEDLKHGRFCIIDTDSKNPLRRIELPLKEVVTFIIEVNNAVTATDEIISKLGELDFEDKIVLLRVEGVLENGKNSEVKFQKIKEFVEQKKAYFFLKNSHNLKSKEMETEVDVGNSENIEEDTIKLYVKENHSEFNEAITQLMSSLYIEKQEGETTENFSKRIIEESKKILKF